MEEINRLKIRLLIFIIIQFLLMVFLSKLLINNIAWMIVFIVSEIACISYSTWYLTHRHNRTILGLSEVLGTDFKDVLLFGECAMLTYDDEYVITWMSDLLVNRGLDRIGQKLLQWLPECDELISGKSDRVDVVIDDSTYCVSRSENSQSILFHDISEVEAYKKQYHDDKTVLGMINLDNYDEATQYEDEQIMSSINNSIRQPIVEWSREFGCLLRRFKNDRYILVLNELSFSKMIENKFSILNTVKKASTELGVSITCSMSFARGSNSFAELDEEVINLMDLAQSRGGDQVVFRKIGEDVKYFGGSSEALEKRSRVRVRIMANTLKDLIVKSHNVIICGHKEMDFDCMGAALCVSRIVQGYHKPCCIIAKTGGIEEKLEGALLKYKKEIAENHMFVSENEANNQLRDDTLVIMVDHHSVAQSNGASVLDKAKKIVILDHHRRGADLSVNPTLVYIEAGASSTCELLSEFVPYLSNNIEINAIEATIMLTGIVIDTNHFKVRTGVRTFEAAAMIKTWGGDPAEVDEYLRDTYDEFELKSLIMHDCEMYEQGIVVAPVEDKVVTRSIMSQVANNILAIRSVEAVFVIAKTVDNEVAISARSSGKINVQVIMEKMKGGGHRSAAALQRPSSTNIHDLKNELLQVVSEYIQEVKEDESNIA